MDTLLIVLASYFGIGLLVLCILDIFTGRIHTELRPASVKVQSKLLTTGNYVGNRSSMVLMLAALWLFWPAAAYAALSSLKGSKDGNKSDG